MDKKDDEFEELEVLDECTYMDDEFDIIAGITKAEVEYDFDELLMVLLENKVLRLEERIEKLEEALLWNE